MSTVMINKRTYKVSEQKADHFLYSNGYMRIGVIDGRGNLKYAQFDNEGNFDIWDTPVKRTIKYGRAINMRK